MSIKYVFFDIHESIVDTHKNILEKIIPNSEFILGNIQNINTIDVYVSPANSFGWMDGGIDAIYSQMFPGIQELVQKHIAQLSPVIFQNRPLLPVGSALITKKGELPNGKLLICAPTMQTPHNIQKHLQNVYYAAIAIFQVCQKLPPGTVIGIPGLGTGVGGLSGEECANLIGQAWTDLQNGKVIYPKESNLDYQQSHFIITPSFLY